MTIPENVVKYIQWLWSIIVFNATCFESYFTCTSKTLMLVTNVVCLYSRRGPARSSYQRWRYRDWKRLWCFWRAGSRRWWNSNLLYLQHNRKICNGDDYFKTRRNWFNASVRSTSVRAIMNILIYFLTKMMV